MVSDAEDALEMIKTYKPDVVLTDMKLSGIDGIELMEMVNISN